MSTEIENTAQATTPVKRGRGRPKGSKNKPKATTDTKITTILKKEEVVKTERKPTAILPTPITSKVKVAITEDESMVESVE